MSDYVAGAVDDRLQRPSHVYEWFDPVEPRPPAADPLPAAEAESLRRLVDSFPLPPANAYPASPDQARAAVEGLLHAGATDPGAAGHREDDHAPRWPYCSVSLSAGGRVMWFCCSAHTHTALDNLLERIDRYLDPFRRHVGGRRADCPGRCGW